MKKRICFCWLSVFLLGIWLTKSSFAQETEIIYFNYPISIDDFDPYSFNNRNLGAPSSNGRHSGEDIDLLESSPMDVVGTGTLRRYKQDGAYPNGYGEFYATTTHQLDRQLKVVLGDGGVGQSNIFMFIYGHIRKRSDRNDPNTELSWPTGTTLSTPVNYADRIGYVNDDANNGDGAEHLHLGARPDHELNEPFGYENLPDAPLFDFSPSHLVIAASRIGVFAADVSNPGPYWNGAQSQAFIDKWWEQNPDQTYKYMELSNYHNKLGRPNDNGTGTDFVHEWYGVWIQDMYQPYTNQSRFGTDGQTALILNNQSPAVAHLLKEGFWGWYKTLVIIDGVSKPQGPIMLGAPIGDEYADAQTGFTRQDFQLGHLEYDTSVSEHIAYDNSGFTIAVSSGSVFSIMNLAASPTSTSAIYLTFGDYANPSGTQYEIYLDGNLNQTVTGSGPTYGAVVNNLSANTAYSVSVKALYNGAESSLAGPVNATTFSQSNPPSGTGAIEVSSNPQGADVWKRNDVQGSSYVLLNSGIQTASTVELAVGNYYMAVKKYGYNDSNSGFETLVNVSDGNTTSVGFTLTANSGIPSVPDLADGNDQIFLYAQSGFAQSGGYYVDEPNTTDSYALVNLADYLQRIFLFPVNGKISLIINAREHDPLNPNFTPPLTYLDVAIDDSTVATVLVDDETAVGYEYTVEFEVSGNVLTDLKLRPSSQTQGYFYLGIKNIRIQYSEVYPALSVSPDTLYLESGASASLVIENALGGSISWTGSASGSLSLSQSSGSGSDTVTVSHDGSSPAAGDEIVITAGSGSLEEGGQVTVLVLYLSTTDLYATHAQQTQDHPGYESVVYDGQATMRMSKQTFPEGPQIMNIYVQSPDLPSDVSAIQKVELILYPTAVTYSSPEQFSVYSVGNSWNDATLSHNTAPSKLNSTPIVTSTGAPLGAFKVLDVTSAFTGTSGHYSVMLEQDGFNNSKIYMFIDDDDPDPANADKRPKFRLTYVPSGMPIATVVAASDSVNVYTEYSTVFSVTANDSMSDGSSFNSTNLSVVSPPANGSVTVIGVDSLSYNSNVGFIGTDVFTYEVSNGTSTAQANVVMTVSSAPGPITTDLYATHAQQTQDHPGYESVVYDGQATMRMSKQTFPEGPQIMNIYVQSPDLPSDVSAIQKVELILYPTAVTYSSPEQFSVYSVGNSWNDATLSHNTAPSKLNSTPIVTSTGAPLGAFKVLDVTSAFTGTSGHYSVMLEQDGFNNSKIYMFIDDDDPDPANADKRPKFRLTYVPTLAKQNVNEQSYDQSVPVDFALHQNYPNPFNPETKINFGLPIVVQTRVTIYNILGQRLSILLDKVLDAGEHSVIWNGKDGFGRQMPTGVYIYTIKAGEFVASKKMLLLK